MEYVIAFLWGWHVDPFFYDLLAVGAAMISAYLRHDEEPVIQWILWYRTAR